MKTNKTRLEKSSLEISVLRGGAYKESMCQRLEEVGRNKKERIKPKFHKSQRRQISVLHHSCKVLPDFLSEYGFLMETFITLVDR